MRVAKRAAPTVLVALQLEMAASAVAAPGVRKTLHRCRNLLAERYGPRLAGLVLYGSVARGGADEESDLDLLVLLQGDFDFFQELDRLTSVLYPVQLDADRHISALPVSLADFERGTLQLYRNAAREGVRL